MRLEVAGEADVLVVGGGPSGIPAALASARSGADVLLVERDASVGGEAARFLPFGSFHTDTGEQVVAGIAQEIVDELVARGGSAGHLEMEGGWGARIVPFDPEALKSVAQDMLRDAGVRLLLGSLAVGVIMNRRTLRGVAIANKGGIQLCLAKVVIDATGDADVASYAGVAFEKGEPGIGAMQPGTLMFRIAGVDEEGVSRCFPPLAPVYGPKLGSGRSGRLHYAGDFKAWRRELEEEGFPFSPELRFWATSIRDGELFVNAARVRDVDSTDPVSLTESEIAGRELVNRICAFLRRHVDGFQDSYLSETATHVGIRESRRIRGEYILTASDVLTGRSFEDGIARGAYGIDIHDGKTDGGWSFQKIAEGRGYYEIPYRCLLPQTTENLLVTGRCISVTREALGSTRIMSTCMALGEAAGVAGALASQGGQGVAAIDTSGLRRRLGMAD